LADVPVAPLLAGVKFEKDNEGLEVGEEDVFQDSEEIHQDGLTAVAEVVAPTDDIVDQTLGEEPSGKNDRVRRRGAFGSLFGFGK
jgi:hypothetical protein